MNTPRQFPYLCFGLLAVIALLTLGPSGDDWFFHLMKIEEVVRGIQAGEFPIYFSPNIAAGKTLPVFVFYPS